MFRRRPARGPKKDETEDEDEADPTVTEASVRRGRGRRRAVIEPEDADTGMVAVILHSYNYIVKECYIRTINE